MEETGRLDRGDGVELAWARLPGTAPGLTPGGTPGATVVFLPGFASDMGGTKGVTLAEFCAARGQSLLRLDYSGHGASGGRFTDGTIGRWTADARLVIERQTTGPLILVGSSMGGWIALLLARAMPDRVAGLLGIAAAPDFTEELMWQAMTFEERARLMETGVLMAPSQYGDPTPITRALIEDGRSHLLLDAPIPVHCPVRLLQGQRDPDVPWETALRIAEQVESEDVRLTLIKDGDHRLSRPQDLALLCTSLAAFLGENGS